MKEYIISDGDCTRAVILPEKGATLTRILHDGVDFLYVDEENLASPERPRCGVPFLFPIFGRLTDWKYTWEGKEYTMDIHGFGHTSPWQVAEHTESTLVLVLEANEETLSQYPFRFRVTLTFRAEKGAVSIHQKYENLGTKPMPYNFGFHPYFRVEKLSHIRVESTAETHADFMKGQMTPLGHGTVGVELPEGAPETGAALLGVTGPTILHIPEEGKQLTMEFSPDYPQHVLWNQGGKPFLCVEPINGTADGLNKGIYLTLNPGEVKEAFVRFTPECI